MIEGYELPKNPPFYPNGGTYADLIFWHLFIWGTRRDGTRSVWRRDTFRAEVFVHNADTETAVRSLNHWLGSGPPPNEANANLVMQALFGEETAFEDWRIHLRIALKKSKGKDSSGKHRNVNSVESLWRKLSNAGGAGSSVQDALPFAHHQFHKLKTEPSNLIELLRTDVRATSLVGRENELAMLKVWLSAPQNIAVKCVVGGAGAGKTRLAIEACERAEADGWFATFLPSSELQPPHDMQALADWVPTQQTLLVVDYAATSVSALKRWLGALALQRNRAGHTLRILLLERHADREGGWWADLLRPDSHTRASSADVIGGEMPSTLLPLDAIRDRRALLMEVMVKAAPLFDPPRSLKELPEPEENSWFDQRLAENHWDTEPLYLILAGIRAVESGAPAALAMNKLDLAKWMADVEAERLRKFAAARGFADDGELLLHTAACVTLQNGCDPSRLAELVKEELKALDIVAPFSARRIAEILCDFLPITTNVEPVRPDLIGESFCLPIIDGGRLSANSEGNEIVLRCWRRDPAGTGDTLIRCACDLAERDATHVSVTYLREIVEQGPSGTPDATLLTALSENIPPDTLALREFAADLSSYIVNQLCLEVAITSDAFAPNLAVALNNMAIRLGDLGRSEEALNAAEQALTLYGQLAATRPDAFTLDLAVALNNIALRFSDLGRREEALDAAQQALVLWQQLVTARPNVFTHNLAAALNNVALRLGDLGRHEEALDAAKQALALRRQLATERPDAFTPNLATALTNIALHFGNLGRREEALDAAQLALALRRQLAAERPDAFTPNLASSLHNVAIRLGDLGRREEALDAAQEALALYRQLAIERPDAFSSNLAATLNSVAIGLGDLGRREEALDAAEQALALYRQLTTARPDAFTPNLATAFNTVANCLSNLGRRREALDMAEQSLALYRKLSAAQPSYFMPSLAMSLNNLAIHLSDLAYKEESINYIEKSIAIYRDLLIKIPNKFACDLANSLSVLSTLLERNGCQQQAMACDHEAIVVLAPYFSDSPQIFEPTMRNLLNKYNSHAKAASIMVDEELMNKIVSYFS